MDYKRTKYELHDDFSSYVNDADRSLSSVAGKVKGSSPLSSELRVSVQITRFVQLFPTVAGPAKDS